MFVFISHLRAHPDDRCALERHVRERSHLVCGDGIVVARLADAELSAVAACARMAA